MNNSKIEWTDRTWNPVTGCTKVSQGCKNCYAERMYERFNGHGSFKKVLTHPERLQQPLKWKKPSKIFVNSMSDLFHEDVPFDFINSVFAIMSCKAAQHTYQVLTKRPERLLEYLKRFKESGINPHWKKFSENIWLGVSVEDQATANERIPLLLQVPAVVRFLSCEPLLGPVDIEAIPTPRIESRNLKGEFALTKTGYLNWIICGGESGPGARPMHPDWARSLREQCAAAGVPFFFKQWGEWQPLFTSKTYTGSKGLLDIKSKKYFVMPVAGGDTVFRRVGKKAAGRLLDGMEYNEFPNVK